MGDRPQSERISIKALDTPRGDQRVWAFQNGELVPISGDDGLPKKLSSETTITSITTGLITASWVDYEGDTEFVTAAALTFNGSGLPGAGNLRFDIIQGLNNGTVSVKQGTVAAIGSTVIPDADPEAVILDTILWNEDGEGIIEPPVVENAWSTKRFTTKIDANTTGKYAKVWEGQLANVDNYAIQLSYHEPTAVSTPFPGSGMRNLAVSFTCDGADIVGDTVQIETDGGETGEFVLYQIAGNRAALYHRSNQYWGRIQFRVLFQNSVVKLADFIDQGVYGAAPGSPVGSWPSTLVSGVSDYSPQTGTTISFALAGGKPRKYGFNGTPITGNLTFSITDANELVMVKVCHNQGTVPTVTAPGGVTGIEETGSEYIVSVDNFLHAICDKNDAGAVTRIRYYWTQQKS